MSVTSRGNRWQASVSRGPGKRWRRSFASDAEAEAWEEDSNRRLDRGELPMMDGGSIASSGPRMTLEELRQATHQRYWTGTKSENWHFSRGRKIVSILGASTLVMNIGAAEVDLVVSRLRAEGKANGTINRHLSALSKMLKTALRYIPKYPRPLIEKLRESEGRLNFYSPEDVDLMASTAVRIGREIMADLIYVAVDTGLRLSELLRLVPTDLIKGKNGKPWLRVRETKGNAERHVPLVVGGRSHHIILARIEKHPEARLFPLTTDRVEHYWRRIRELIGKADDKEWVFHVFRHTYCTRLALGGAGVKSIMKLAGHKSVATAMRYIKVTPDSLMEAVENAAMG